MAQPITINSAYPWGRSFDEYRQMFALTDADLDRRILGCADGPAAFNPTMHGRGKRVISCDPLYRFSADEIRRRIDETFVEILDLATRERERFVWDAIASPEELGRVRMGAMEEFLRDYEGGRAEGRYVESSLPHLPFNGDAFDLALCSHFLFLYSELGLELHLASVMELLRVAEEVRIFPLLDMKGNRSGHVDSIRSELSACGHSVTLERVPYEFQRGGCEMMRIRRKPQAVNAPSRGRSGVGS